MLGLAVHPGTHRRAATTPPRKGGLTLDSRRGDAIIFDTRLWHRSGHQFSADKAAKQLRAHKADAPPADTAKRSSVPMRSLLTLSYGVLSEHGSGRHPHPNLFSIAHAKAIRMRNQLVTNRVPGCNVTLPQAALALGTVRTRPNDRSAMENEALRCVRRAIDADIQASAQRPHAKKLAAPSRAERSYM